MASAWDSNIASCIGKAGKPQADQAEQSKVLYLCAHVQVTGGGYLISL